MPNLLRPVRSLACCLSLLCLTVSAQAQSQLFDIGNEDLLNLEPAKSKTGFPEPPPEPPEPTALEIQLLEHAARGKMQLAEAIGSMARIGQWDQVERLLNAAGNLQLSEDELAAMAGLVKSHILLRISLHEELSDAAKAVANRMSAAAIKAAESPVLLDTAIGNLGSDQRDQQMGGARTLLGGGLTAISQLTAAAVAENPPAPRDRLLHVLIEMGDDGQQALGQLALYGTPVSRRNAMVSLAKMQPDGAIAELVTAIHAADSTPDEIDIAKQIFARRSIQPPTREQAVSWLARQLRQVRSDAETMENQGQFATAWTVNPARTGVDHQTTSVMALRYREAVDMSARLRRIGGLPLAVMREAMLADIEYRLLIDPDWGSDSEIQSLKAAFPTLTDPDELLAAIDRATQENNELALVGLLRLIDPSLTVDESRRLLQSTGGVPTALVAAASSPFCRVRFEAASAISQISQGLPYAGSSHVRYCLGEMRNLPDQPQAVVLETRSEVILQHETLLSKLGYRVSVASSAAELTRLVASGGDIQMILSKTEIADATAVEVVDLVRRMDRGREIPIVFYGSPAEGLEDARWSAPLTYIEWPSSGAAFFEINDSLQRRRRLPPLSAVDRRTYRDQANQVLAELAKLN